jgi:predicted RNA binding protein YcfA (HicA-like mRNA interferase family)
MCIRCVLVLGKERYGNSSPGRASCSTPKTSSRDGWYRVGQTGSHVHFKHETKPGKITVPHPVKDLPIGTLKSIEKASGVKLR